MSCWKASSKNFCLSFSLTWGVGTPPCSAPGTLCGWSASSSTEKHNRRKFLKWDCGFFIKQQPLWPQVINAVTQCNSSLSRKESQSQCANSLSLFYSSIHLRIAIVACGYTRPSKAAAVKSLSVLNWAKVCFITDVFNLSFLKRRMCYFFQKLPSWWLGWVLAWFWCAQTSTKTKLSLQTYSLNEIIFFGISGKFKVMSKTFMFNKLQQSSVIFSLSQGLAAVHLIS